MTAIITKFQPRHAGLVDKHGNPLSDQAVRSIALSGHTPDANLIDLAKDMPATAKHTVVFPAPARIGLRGGEVESRINGEAHLPRWERELIAHVRDIFEKTGVPLIAGGAAGAWTLTNNTRTYSLNGTFDYDTDSFKIALLLSTSNIGASSTTYAGLTNEHANANGYTTGGIAQTLSLSGTTTVTISASASPTWTASGGSIVARFAVLYEVSGNVACYCLLDSTPADVTTTTGNTFTISTTGGILQAA